jgi:hypothetical protein
MAIWVEDSRGTLIETLYVTRKFATQSWGGTWPDRTDDATFRRAALPYWLHRMVAAGRPSPTRNSPLPDAVTGATPRGAFTLRTRVAADVPEVAVLLEVNNSFDENGLFPNQGGGPGTEYNGQPAVVYRAVVTPARPGRYDMVPIGRSSHDGQDGSLTVDLQGLTTARGIIGRATVVIP